MILREKGDKDTIVDMHISACGLDMAVHVSGIFVAYFSSVDGCFVRMGLNPDEQAILRKIGFDLDTSEDRVRIKSD